MIDDIKKSINSILYERTTSPLWGTIIISWTVWNWKILYLTLFVSQDKIDGTKIDYIINNFSDKHFLITFPLLSTFILLTIIPFLANGAFWITLKFNKWKIDQKNSIEKKQLLTLEQSIELREQIINQEEKFEKLLETKNLEIKQLKIIIDDYKKADSEQAKKFIPEFEIDSNESELIDLAQKIKNNKGEIEAYDNLLFGIQNNWIIREMPHVNSKLVATLEAYNIIDKNEKGLYKLTDVGKKFHRMVTK